MFQLLLICQRKLLIVYFLYLSHFFNIKIKYNNKHSMYFTLNLTVCFFLEKWKIHTLHIAGETISTCLSSKSKN